MDCVRSKLTVFFQEPFWVGIYEREDAGRYEVCKSFVLITKAAGRRRYDPGII